MKYKKGMDRDVQRERNLGRKANHQSDRQSQPFSPHWMAGAKVPTVRKGLSGLVLYGATSLDGGQVRTKHWLKRNRYQTESTKRRRRCGVTAISAAWPQSALAINRDLETHLCPSLTTATIAIEREDGLPPPK